MTNNFDIIKDLLEFESEDDFYFLQILKRKKENPELGSNSVVVKTYYIKSLENLDMKRDEIINLCQLYNARAYINLNVRSFESVAFHMLKKVTDIIMNKDYKSVRNAYDSVCGAHGTGKNKKWIIDIDNTNEEYDREMREFINTECRPVGMKIIANIPTKNGHHLITNCFDLMKFREKYPDEEIHKNNPSVLYVP
jgi:hypothetical protein